VSSTARSEEGNNPERASSDYTGRGTGSKASGQLTILQVVPRLTQGGVERGTLEVVEAIIGSGGRALVATAGGQLEVRVAKAGGEIVPMAVDSKNPLVIWRNAALLSRLVEQEGVDIVHARSRAPAWSAYWACKRTGSPFITTYHGTYKENLPFKRLYNSVMARGRPVIAISEFIRGIVRERHGVPDDQIVTIPRGADISVFAEEAVGNERAIKIADQWGLIDDARAIVLMPGRLTRWKGGESMIEAAALLKEKRGSDFAVLMIGDDETGFGATLEKKIDETGTRDVVLLTGGVQDMAAAYKLASVVVSASIEPEAFGRVVVEAQAMSKPVIATNHGGARETVVNGESGWLYPPGDARALAETIHRALELTPSERAHMGLAGRARIHSSYTVSAMQRATLSVYEQVAGRTFQTLV
jgi:glycosyltransferase involved in cell wall biosynthesis